MFAIQRSASLRLAFAAALVVAAFITRQSDAQNFERYRPRMPASSEGESQLPDRVGDLGGDPTVLVEELKGLVFVDDREKVTANREAVGIVIDEASHLPSLDNSYFRSIAGEYIGKPVSIARLNQLVRDVIIYYRNSDMPVVDVNVPEQDITDGVVHVVVTEALIGQIRVQGGTYFDPQVLLRQIYSSPGSIVFESMLLEDLRWLNRNPFREVDISLEPGGLPGETAVVFNVQDRVPVRVYAGYEDSGTRFTGLERTFYGINWGNAFGKDHSLGYQYTASSDFDALDAHSGVYEIPLLNRDILTFFGSYAQIQTKNATLPPNSGHAWQVASRYRRNLCGDDCIDHFLEFGLDFKQTNTNLEFGGTQVFTSSADIIQFTMGYDRTRTDDWGASRMRADLVYGPSGISGGNTTTTYQTVRADATADYFYARGSLDREVYLPSIFLLYGRVTGQIAEGNLLPSEQLGFGGYDSIRGYDNYLVVGDSGVIVNLELRTQPTCLGIGGLDDQLQLAAFYDFGEARNHTVTAGGDPSVDLSSLGAGLRYALAQRASLRADYAWQTNQVVSGVPTPRHRIHIGVVVSH